MDPLNALIADLAVYGAFGLMAIAFAERFVPIIPSTAMLMTIGAAAADGFWQPWVAIMATVLGGSIGFAVGFFIVSAFSGAGANRLPLTINRMQGRISSLLEAAAGNRAGVALSLQLVPTARLLAPVIALLPRARQSELYLASFVGIAIWNALFIGAGYLAALTAEAANLTCMVVSLSIGLVLAQSMIVFLINRWSSGDRASS